ncbi:hypothetical protein BN165_450003 [Clostridioides difficile E1]|nr:hypothetical protein BN163_480003 [Clostridioides difficile T5]CCK92962.1 hypothetical protein BN164_430003 [Clostridioides difficile T20]CCK96590.1 hypothetical protein BN165_450003 [Clostridioides difficile E1]CCL00559.1 hypothetical protein BN166_460003 [Clostridioides difficile E10]
MIAIFTKTVPNIYFKSKKTESDSITPLKYPNSTIDNTCINTGTDTKIAEHKNLDK